MALVTRVEPEPLYGNVVSPGMGTVPVVTTQPYTIGHFSDTHIGYEAYKARSVSGENQRAVDIARAFVKCIDEIIAADPPLVIHSGDVSDRTIIPIRLLMLIQQQFRRIASLRPDGTRRQLVVIAGNHELPRNKKEACLLELLRGIPGVHVVSTQYEKIRFTGEGLSENFPRELEGTVVHALPHDTLKEVDFETIQPEADAVNILTAHGVAGGSELYVRSLGREFAIPSEVLSRSWEYVALGHWHKQGPIPLVGAGGSRRGDTSVGRAWYAGSTENMGFGDLKDNGLERGWLEVTVNPGADPAVKRRVIPIRHMERLPHLEATGMSAEVIEEELISRIKAARVSGAIIGQVVDGVTRETWSLVDLPRVRAAASDALHYEVSVKHRHAAAQERDHDSEGLGEIDLVLEQRAQEILDEHERSGGLTLARHLVHKELARQSSGGDAGKVAAEAADDSERSQQPEGSARPAADEGVRA